MINVRSLMNYVEKAYFQLNINQRLYLNSFVLLVVYLSVARLLEEKSANGLLHLFYIFWIIAIGYDLIKLYTNVYETVLGKAFFIVLFSFCANMAIVISNQAVNDIVGIDPSKFPHTIAFLSILTIPFFIIVGVSILSLVLIIAIPIFFMVHTLQDEKTRAILFPWYSSTEKIPYPKTTRLIQLVSLTVLCGMVYSSSQNSTKSYEAFFSSVARSFIFQFEMYSKAPCIVPSGNRIAYIGDEKILVGTKNGDIVSFKIQECKGI